MLLRGRPIFIQYAVTVAEFAIVCGNVFNPPAGATHPGFLRVDFLHVIATLGAVLVPHAVHVPSFTDSPYSTVTLFARFLGWSTSQPLMTLT